MGIIKNIIGKTKLYKKYQQSKAEKYSIEKELFEKNLLPKKEQLYKNFVENGDLVFDVGANVGNRIEPMLNIGAKIVAVEPQPNCVEILKQKFDKKILIESVGIGETSTTLEMFIASDSTISSFSNEFIEKTKKTRFKNYEWNKSIKVPIVTLESLIEKYGVPKFCKIDVEGFELQVLKGLKTAIPYISLEYCVPEMSVQLIECLETLNQISPQAKYNFSIGETMTLYFDEWKTFNEIVSFIMTDDFIDTAFGDIYFNAK